MTDEGKHGNLRKMGEDVTEILQEGGLLEDASAAASGSVISELVSRKGRVHEENGGEKRLVRRFLEIRFKPWASILDKRGKIAEALSSKRFDRWTISENTVVFSSSRVRYTQAFFSFTNLGFGITRTRPVEEFNEGAIEFVRKAWQFFLTNEITRIGVRSIFLSEVQGFKETMGRFRNRFLKLSEAEVEKFGGDLVDVGFPLNFSVGDRRFNIMTGAMEKEQALERYGRGEELPQAGIYVDVDYFKSKFKRALRQKDVFAFIKSGTAKGQEINKVIFDLIVEKRGD